MKEQCINQLIKQPNIHQQIK